MSELLTQNENECLELLADAWNKYLELPSLHPTDRQEFMQAIHSAQNILFARIYLRSAQQSVQPTAFGVGVLAFLAGFFTCWLAFVR